MPDDKIQREIEDILNKLDTFIPEESPASRVRRRSSDAASSVVHTLLAPFAGISIRHIMLTALLIIVVGFVGMRVSPLIGRWMLVGGVILFLTSFALSLLGRNSAPGPTTERRWRGRPIDLSEPSLGDRIRSWFQNKRRPRP